MTFICFALYGAVCVQLVLSSLDERKDVFITNLIIFAQSEVSHFTCCHMFRGCMSGVVGPKILSPHYSDVIMCFKSQVPRLFAQPFVQAQIEENIKVPCHWPLWGESIGDHWTPLTKGQWRRKCFHLMTICSIHIPGLLGFVANTVQPMTCTNTPMCQI